MKKKLFFLIPIIIVVVVFFGVYGYYNKQDAKNALTVTEKKWVEENKSNVIDFSVINDYPLYGLNGKGVFFNFLKDFEQDVGLEFNKVSYLKEAKISSKGYSFRILDNDTKLSKNDLLLFNDGYIALGREYQRINNITDMKNITFGVLKDDASDISYYLKSGSDLVYKSYSDVDSLFNALDSNEVGMIIIPNIMYLNNIINNSMDLNELKKLLDFEDIKTKHEKFVFFIDYFVNWFFNNHDIEKRTNKIGRPRYSEISLCKVLILASSEGITSGRKINTKLLFDTRYQKLMNYETPSYHLINDFKRKSHQIISDLFVDCVKFAQYYQFLDLSTIAIDGSKIRANASKSKILKMEDIYFLQYIFKQEKTQQFTNQIEKSHTISRKDKLIKEAQKYLIETKKEINKNNSKQKKKVRKGCINYLQKQ